MTDEYVRIVSLDMLVHRIAPKTICGQFSMESVKVCHPLFRDPKDKTKQNPEWLLEFDSSYQAREVLSRGSETIDFELSDDIFSCTVRYEAATVDDLSLLNGPAAPVFSPSIDAAYIADPLFSHPLLSHIPGLDGKTAGDEPGVAASITAFDKVPFTVAGFVVYSPKTPVLAELNLKREGLGESSREEEQLHMFVVQPDTVTTAPSPHGFDTFQRDPDTRFAFVSPDAASTTNPTMVGTLPRAPEGMGYRDPLPVWVLVTADRPASLVSDLFRHHTSMMVGTVPWPAVCLRLAGMWGIPYTEAIAAINTARASSDRFLPHRPCPVHAKWEGWNDEGRCAATDERRTRALIRATLGMLGPISQIDAIRPAPTPAPVPKPTPEPVVRSQEPVTVTPRQPPPETPPARSPTPLPPTGTDPNDVGYVHPSRRKAGYTPPVKRPTPTPTPPRGPDPGDVGYVHPSRRAGGRAASPPPRPRTGWGHTAPGSRGRGRGRGGGGWGSSAPAMTSSTSNTKWGVPSSSSGGGGGWGAAPTRPTPAPKPAPIDPMVTLRKLLSDPTRHAAVAAEIANNEGALRAVLAAPPARGAIHDAISPTDDQQPEATAAAKARLLDMITSVIQGQFDESNSLTVPLLDIIKPIVNGKPMIMHPKLMSVMQKTTSWTQSSVTFKKRPE